MMAVVNCEVLEVKPFTKLSYSWNGRTQDKSRNYQFNGGVDACSKR